MKIYVLATLAVLATAAAEGHDTRHHLRGKEVKQAVKADKGILSSLNNSWHSAVDYAKNKTEDLFGDDDDDDDEDEDEDEDDEKEERRPMMADKGILSSLNNTWHSAVDYAKNKTDDLFGDDDDEERDDDDDEDEDEDEDDEKEERRPMKATKGILSTLNNSWHSAVDYAKNKTENLFGDDDDEDEDEDEDDEEEKDEKPKLPLKAHKGILSSLNNTWHSAVDYAKNKTEDLFGDDDDDDDEDEDEDEDDEKEERRPMKATKGILSTLNNSWHSAVDYAKNKTDDLFGDDDDEESDDDDDEDEDAKEEKYVHWELDEDEEKEDRHPVQASKGILSSLNSTWHSAVDYAKNKTDDLFGDDDEESDDDDDDDEKDDDEKEEKNVRAVKQHAAMEPAKITITFKHHA